MAVKLLGPVLLALVTRLSTLTSPGKIIFLSPTFH